MSGALETERDRIGIVEMYAATPPGICPFCGDPIPAHPGRGRKPITCGDPVCRTAYFRCYARDRRGGRLSVGQLMALRPRPLPTFEVSRGGVTPHPEPSFR